VPAGLKLDAHNLKHSFLSYRKMRKPGDVQRFGHVTPFAKYRNCPQPGGKLIETR
jgi:hypothetical protein